MRAQGAEDDREGSWEEDSEQEGGDSEDGKYSAEDDGAAAAARWRNGAAVGAGGQTAPAPAPRATIERLMAVKG